MIQRIRKNVTPHMVSLLWVLLFLLVSSVAVVEVGATTPPGQGWNTESGRMEQFSTVNQDVNFAFRDVIAEAHRHHCSAPTFHNPWILQHVQESQRDNRFIELGIEPTTWSITLPSGFAESYTDGRRRQSSTRDCVACTRGYDAGFHPPPPVFLSATTGRKNVVLIVDDDDLDESTTVSVRGNKLELLQSTARTILETLQNDDRIAVLLVAPNNHHSMTGQEGGQTLYPATRENKDKLIALINRSPVEMRVVDGTGASNTVMAFDAAFNLLENLALQEEFYDNAENDTPCATTVLVWLTSAGARHGNIPDSILMDTILSRYEKMVSWARDRMTFLTYTLANSSDDTNNISNLPQRLMCQVERGVHVFLTQDSFHQALSVYLAVVTIAFGSNWNQDRTVWTGTGTELTSTVPVWDRGVWPHQVLGVASLTYNAVMLARALQVNGTESLLVTLQTHSLQNTHRRSCPLYPASTCVLRQIQATITGKDTENYCGDTSCTTIVMGGSNNHRSCYDPWDPSFYGIENRSNRNEGSFRKCCLDQDGAGNTIDAPNKRSWIWIGGLVILMFVKIAVIVGLVTLYKKWKAWISPQTEQCKLHHDCSENESANDTETDLSTDSEDMA